MGDLSVPAVLVVIFGPQASGKSTVAVALAAELRRRDECVALVELDAIAAMALPTLPSWQAAHTIFASVVGQWARAGLTCVIAEGSGSLDEVNELIDRAPSDVTVVTVASTAAFEVAFSRARRDSSRGVSREHDFLSGVYRQWSETLPGMRTDVLIDTGELSVAASAAAILVAIDRARRADAASR